MEMFARGSLFQTGFQQPISMRPRMGQSQKETSRQIIERMRSMEDRYDDLLARNQVLSNTPNFVHGYFEQNLRGTADNIQNNWINALDRRPDRSYWDAPASPEMINDAEQFNNDLTKFEVMISRAEKANADKEAAAKAAAKGQTPATILRQGEATGDVAQSGMLPPTGMLVLGLVAIGSFVGAALLGTGESLGF